jgi:hypothetical protein
MSDCSCDSWPHSLKSTGKVLFDGDKKALFKKGKCIVNFIYVFIKRFTSIRPLTCKIKSLSAKLNIWKYKSRLNYQKRNLFIFLTKYN